METRIIAMLNQKGGVGKTTSVANLGAGLVRFGRRVLLIDADPQANLSVHFGVDIHQLEKSIYDVMMNEARAGDVLIKTELDRLDLLPSHIGLSSAELQLVGMVGRETILKEAIQHLLPDYDYVLIDCPPSLGLLTLNALTTAREVFIPLQTEFFALEGMSHLLNTINLVKRRVNHNLEITGIIPCMHDSRTKLAQAVLDKIRGYFGEKVFRTVIRKNVKLAESPSHGKPIILYDPEAAGAHDYMALTREVIAQELRFYAPVQIPSPPCEGVKGV